MLTPKTNSQTYWQRAISHVMNEIIFSICSISSCSVLQTAPKRCPKECNKDQEKRELLHIRSQRWTWSRILRQALRQLRVRVHQVARRYSEHPVSKVRISWHRVQGNLPLEVQIKMTQRQVLKCGSQVQRWTNVRGKSLLQERTRIRFIIFKNVEHRTNFRRLHVWGNTIETCCMAHHQEKHTKNQVKTQIQDTILNFVTSIVFPQTWSLLKLVRCSTFLKIMKRILVRSCSSDFPRTFVHLCTCEPHLRTWRCVILIWTSSGRFPCTLCYEIRTLLTGCSEYLRATWCTRTRSCRKACRSMRDQVQRRLRMCNNSLFSWSLLHSFGHRFGDACWTEHDDIEQMEKIISFITCEIALSQYVCELVFGVNIFDFGFFGPGFILSNNQSGATLWVRDTCLIVGLLP